MAVAAWPEGPEDFLGAPLPLAPAARPAPKLEAKGGDEGIDKLAEWLEMGPSFPPELLFPDAPGESALQSFVRAHDPEAEAEWPLSAAEEG